MRPLSQKVGQKCVPFSRISDHVVGPRRSRVAESPWGTPLGIRIKREFCHFRRVFSCIWRRAGSDPQAERGRGEVNLSPKEGLTLRPRVGGVGRVDYACIAPLAPCCTLMAVTTEPDTRLLQNNVLHTKATKSRQQPASSKQRARGGRRQAAGSSQQPAGSRQQAAGGSQQAAGSRQHAALSEAQNAEKALGAE